MNLSKLHSEMTSAPDRTKTDSLTKKDLLKAINDLKQSAKKRKIRRIEVNNKVFDQLIEHCSVSLHLTPWDIPLHINNKIKNKKGFKVIYNKEA